MTIEDPAAADARSGHDRCLLCGERNPRSLRLAFHAEGDWVSADFMPGRDLQGYEDILHGGVIAALLDAAMTHCLFHRGIQAVTGDLRVRYLKSVSCRASLKIKARLVSSRPPLFCLESRIVQDRCTMARAEAKFMRRSEGR